VRGDGSKDARGELLSKQEREEQRKLRRRRKRKRQVQRREEHLRLLGECLVARHLRISVPDGEVRDAIAAAAESGGSYPAEQVERSMRCIAVVGAGASFPLLGRGNELADMLEAKYGKDDVELDRLELVNSLSRKSFEARLIALSKTPDAAKHVRQTIADEYNVTHPTVLSYELLAHLLKHRFLDAIISFNFDELLDRSLDDELDRSEYVRILSDRDCADVQPDADADDYVPLYIKLHGSATEPDSLRFTPDSYYSLPTRVVGLVEDLLNVTHCTVVNVGAGLGSFDFQRLLGLPRRLQVFDLSYQKLKPAVRSKIEAERGKAHPDSKPERWLFPCNVRRQGCDEHLLGLCRAIRFQARELDRHTPNELGRLVDFRSTLRHVTLARFLGSKKVGSLAAAKPEWSATAEIDYLRQRTILELALAAAKARGLVSLLPLVRDRPARYFDLYKRKVPGGAERWIEMCSAAGLVETETIPDVLVSVKGLRASGKHISPPTIAYGERDDTQLLHPYDPVRLAELVMRRVGNPCKKSDRTKLAKTLSALQKESDTELHTQDDRVCSKAFRRPTILRTRTSLNAYTWLMLRDLGEDDEIRICSESGEWLTKDPTPDRIGARKTKALLAFNTETEKLREHYPESQMEICYVNPWHHNRHMTIVFRDGQPHRAIYFARHLRTPAITAVYLDSVRDVQHLNRVFEIRWHESKPPPDPPAQPGTPH
jgi:hypothetical protein